MQTTITYPLPSAFLPTVQLTEEEAGAHRDAAREIVVRTLEQELEFRRDHKGRLDDRKWKFVKGRDGLRVFKRVANENTAIPMVVAVGHLEGTIEDTVYGVHHKTTEEMRLTTAFLNKHHVDSAVLATIDSGTAEDPFRFLGVKWRMTETPGWSLIRNRDACVLEYVGIGVDSFGEKYGFHMMKSVDVAWFPELPDPNLIRARLMMCCIHRQESPQVVATYMKGVFDLGGEMMDLLAYQKAADTVLGIARSIDCAEAKRLTLRILQTQQHSSLGGERMSSSLCRARRSTAGFRRSRMQSSSAELGAWKQDDSRSMSVVSSSHSSDSNEGMSDTKRPTAPAAQGDKNVCAVCERSRGVLAKLGASWDVCLICRQHVCGKCHVNKLVFARPRNVRVPCCKACILEAKLMPVDPRDPYPILPDGIHV
ncbi:hypothetical protein PINS_up006639 [Pythium insidiosum]|nr:hypothetical protein PINS_up006639 [Pythium insidiosum]